METVICFNKIAILKVNFWHFQAKGPHNRKVTVEFSRIKITYAAFSKLFSLLNSWSKFRAINSYGALNAQISVKCHTG